jgi:hypothetical protein
METTKRTRKLQSKVEPDLENHVKEQEDFSGMSDYIRVALIQKSKFKKKR